MRIGILSKFGTRSYDLADLPPNALKQLGIDAEDDDPFKRLFPPGLIAPVYKPASIVSTAGPFFNRRQLTQLWRQAVADKKQRESAATTPPQSPAEIRSQSASAELMASTEEGIADQDQKFLADLADAAQWPVGPPASTQPSALEGGGPIHDAKVGPSSQPTTQPSSRPAGQWDLFSSTIEQHEGRRHIVYTDSKGHPTIGIGFNLDRSDASETISDLLPGVTLAELLNGQPLSDKQIDTLLSHDIDQALREARSQLSDFDQLATQAQIVVVDMIFNMGASKFAEFQHFKAALEIRDYGQAMQEMIDSKWYKEVPNRAEDDVEIMEQIIFEKQEVPR